MQAHVNQALHNENFINECIKNHPDSFFDWKVTASFYTALHLFRAFCELRGVDPGRTHQDIANNFDPKRTSKPLTSIAPFVWKNYIRLQRYSENARYEVFLEPDVENEIQRGNFGHCLTLLNELKSFFHKQGVPCQKDKAA
ncbi:hypothetical protein TH53_19685 [Pedobacter lusitanus]|uniref:Contig93, whole genome shotgun sequence n=1 Tax=Pedobacter lusitanus TaxID=1503925 RepID=A0A0D0F1Q6_9SPHI|nr:hypothetical protein [Pedobacter lusitanus]KIO75563.1 hypothetical protein TH53_19685 [Pedobacter lusitanus]